MPVCKSSYRQKLAFENSIKGIKVSYRTGWLSGFLYSHLLYDDNIKKEEKSKEDWQMKGYDTSNGYMGYVEGKYILFASEREYFEFMED